jgi:hypothetical protein
LFGNLTESAVLMLRDPALRDPEVHVTSSTDSVGLVFRWVIDS